MAVAMTSIKFAQSEDYLLLDEIQIKSNLILESNAINMLAYFFQRQNYAGIQKITNIRSMKKVLPIMLTS